MVAAATLQISKSSALRILHYFVDFVVAKLGVIEMPTASERDVIRRKFRELASRHPLSSPDPLIPAFIGAIDGSHLPIRVPIGRHADFINYKGYTSFNMQAVVSPDYRFLHVSCGAPGRLSDGQHYRHTDFEAQVPDGWMLPGDAGYRLSLKMLTPHSRIGALTPEQMRYNHIQSSMRIVVENTFAILKNKFQILRTPINFPDLHFTARITLVCCRLHNWLLRDRTDWPAELPDFNNFVPSLPISTLRHRVSETF